MTLAITRKSIADPAKAMSWNLKTTNLTNQRKITLNLF